jgi:tRNA (guanine37-N1)-methyltransferase
MRIDVVTIFPEFFDVLDVSLVGKARENGILDVIDAYRHHGLRDTDNAYNVRTMKQLELA